MDENQLEQSGERTAKLIIDSNGTVKEIPVTGEASEQTDSENRDVNSQNDLDLNQYNVEKREVPTQSTDDTSDGKRYYLDPKNPLAYNHENKEFEPVQGSKEALQSNTLWVARDKSAPDQESFKRQDELRRFRDQTNVGKNENLPEETKPESNTSDSIQTNENPVDIQNLSQEGQDALAQQEQLKEQIQKEQRHQQELKDAETRNDPSFKGNESLSQEDQDALAQQEQLKGQTRSLREALDKNERLNEGYTSNTISQGYRDLPEKENIGHFDTMMEPDEAKRYENSFGQLENLKTVSDIQKEIAQKIQTANTTESTSSQSDQTAEKTDLDREIILALQQIIDFVNKSREKFPNDPSIQQSINNIVINIGKITVNIGSTKSETTVNTENISTTTEQKVEEPSVIEENVEQNQGTQQAEPTTTEESQVSTEQENVTPEDERTRDLINWIESLTNTLAEMKGKYTDNPQIQQVINNILINIGSITVGTVNQTGIPGQQTSTGTSSQPVTTSTTTNTTIPTTTVETETTEASATTQGTESQELSWEQQSAILAQELERLDTILKEERDLTVEERLHYFDTLKKKEYIDSMIIAPAEQESERKRNNKEKWIRIGATAAGIGLALATPAVGVAAIIGVTLGGNILGRQIKKWGESLRSKSTALKYEIREGKSAEEIEALDKKQKRNEWWANRLGELSAVVVGGTTGYGAGKFLQNIFGWGTQQMTPSPQASTASETIAETPQPITEGHIEPQPIPQGSIQTPVQGGGVELSGESVLVQNGRVNLPGSAWNGNFAQGPAQDILAGGAANHSNYAGGIYDMAASTLEKDLITNGVTRTKLFETMQTQDVHRLLNRYVDAIRSGNVQPSLKDAISSVKPDAVTSLLGN